MLKSLAHIAIAVPSLDKAIAHLNATYGVSASGFAANPEQGVKMAYLQFANGVRIELMEPTSPETPVGKYLKSHPKGGVHHLAFAVDDINDTVARLNEKDVKIVSRPGAQNVDGQGIAFIHPQDFLGVLVELEEH